MRTSTTDKLLRAAAGRKDIISFAGGLPAPETFPREALARAAEQATLAMGDSPFQYEWPEGRMPLRVLIAQRLAKRGARVDPDDVIITNGAQDALSLALEVLKPNEIHVDHATYPGALDLFSAKGVKATVRMNTPVAYVMPAVHNPWGWKMTPERRAQALQAGVIIEDDAYADLLFDGVAPRPLLADAAHKVFAVGTVSKTVSPGLRVGWLVAPPRWRAQLRAAKSGRDLQAGGLSQAIVEQLLASGDYDARLQRLREHYRIRCERMLELLPQVQGIRFGMPQGGFSIWVETEGLETDERLLARALARGVAFDPGTLFRAEPHAHSSLSMRLSFSAVPFEQMEEGVTRLGAALAEARRSHPRVAA